MKVSQFSLKSLSSVLIPAAVALLPGAMASPAQAVPQEPLQTAVSLSSPVPLKPELPPLGSVARYLPDTSAQLRLVLRLSERRVYLYQDEQVLASYPVAVGKPGWETPTGSFKISHKVKNPSWESPLEKGVFVPPGPDNPLGDRLIVFAELGSKGFVGFHGTPNESLIGRAVSHGCVRMRNNDIRSLFEKVKVNTPVIVIR
jgi:lipoprotein-anchoring transpeptidase ErfK/SrfK